MEILAALEHHRAGRLVEAIDIYQRILQADPNNADALHLMGNVACQLGNADLAISLIARAIGIAPRNTAYLLSMGMARRAQGRFDEALDCYAKVLALEPESASAHFGIGNTRQAQGRLDEAAASFGRALELNPDSVEARYNLANLQKAAGRYGEAAENYRLAIARQPDFADAHHNLGSTLSALGKPDEAMASYERALCGNLPETHNSMGALYAEKGQYEDALACYRQAVAVKADFAAAYNNIGNALRGLGRLDEALQAFEQALRLEPDYAMAHLNLGHVQAQCGLSDDAVHHFETAAALAPEMAEAHFALGVARHRQGDLQAAYACFENAVARRPDYADALYNMGWINARLGRRGEAEDCYRRVLACDPDHINAHINLSSVLMEDGRSEEARAHIDFAYSRQNLFEKQVPGAARTVLILFDAGMGNMNLSHLFNERTNSLLDWMIEYATEEQFNELPPHDLVFNAMGDPDVARGAGEPVVRFLDGCTKPVLNHPAKVARTARDRLPSLLEGIDNLVMAPVWRLSDADDWGPAAAELPLLVRPVHTQGGVGLVQVDTPQALAACRERQAGPVYVMGFVDFRAADSWYRKYRVIFIDRKPYPYHLAISQHWMVHYYTADMESFPWKLEEERMFLQNPEAVLGTRGMATLEAIGARLDLDYAGIDFSLLPDGRLLVFEANPTMLVHPERANGPLAHKNPCVRAILDAFEALLERTATGAA